VNVLRCPDNPIIKPKDIKPSRDDFEIIGVFNPGVACFGEEVILLLRVAERPIQIDPDVVRVAIYDAALSRIVTKDIPRDIEGDFSDARSVILPNETFLTSISHLKVARSIDGISFEIEQGPAMTAANEYETCGIEDARITLIGDTYYIDYVAVSPYGVSTALASTKDFKSFERHGIVFCPENKDVVLFPEKIHGKYYALHRPESALFKKREIWISESPDLRCWGNHRRLMGHRDNLWDEAKIGASAVPFRIDAGWVEIYHGADLNNRYCLGAVLLDGDQPWKVIARADEPILSPEADYECDGFFSNVVFSCGLICEQEKLKVYYGVADTSIAYAEIPLKAALAGLRL